MGYVHDTQMSQYLGPNTFHYVTGTWTQAAGAVADTIAMHRAAANETAVVNIPIMIPSNAAGYKGALLKSIEVDYELLVAGVTSFTPVLNKVTRGADTAVAVVSVPTITYLPAQSSCITQDQHKLVVTLTTPEWIDNDVYFLLELTIVAGAGGNTTDILGAVVNYTLRV
jgi:hypothetical protein